MTSRGSPFPIPRGMKNIDFYQEFLYKFIDFTGLNNIHFSMRKPEENKKEGVINSFIVARMRRIYNWILPTLTKMLKVLKLSF